MVSILAEDQGQTCPARRVPLRLFGEHSLVLGLVAVTRARLPFRSVLPPVMSSFVSPLTSVFPTCRSFVFSAIDAVLTTVVDGIMSADITPVVDAYAHALTASWPRGRYLVGKDARFLWLPVHSLPEWLGDFLFEFLATLSGNKPTPAACKN